MSKKEKERHSCYAVLSSSWPARKCSRTGVVHKEGKWYCKQHDPDLVDALDKARHDQWEREYQASNVVGQWENILNMATDQLIRSAIRAKLPAADSYTKALCGHDEALAEYKRIKNAQKRNQHEA